MATKIQTVTSSNWTPLSAIYPYDDTTHIINELYTTDAGYTFFDTPLFGEIKDIKSAKSSIFCLTGKISPEDAISSTSVVSGGLDVFFTELSTSGTSGLVVSGDNIVQSDGEELLSYFRFSKNINDTYKISVGTDFMTVVLSAASAISLQPEIASDDYNTQSFNLHFGTDELKISAAFNPDLYLTLDSSSQLAAIGNSTTPPFYIETHSEPFSIGYDGEVKWIKYFNEVYDKRHNNDTEIREYVGDVKNNYLVDIPYKTKITIHGDVGSFECNFVALKSHMTPEYEFRMKP